MKAFVIAAPGRTEIREIDPPPVGPGDVLLRVRVVGFCGSDLKTFLGLNPLVNGPRIPGHEVSATIESAGQDVPAEFRPGMDVTLSPYTSCGACPACRRERPNCCRDNQTLGVQRDGALTEYVVVPWQKLFTSGKLNRVELALVEPLTVGGHAIDRAAVAAADTVTVLGCGAIGLGAVAAAAFRGARVVAVDIDEVKLDLARQAGAEQTINSRGEPLHDRLAELTGGDGPEVVVEAIGLPQTFRAAVDEVAFAGRVVYIGYAKEPVTYDTKHFVQKELDVMGSRNAMPENFRQAIRMLEAGRFPVNGVVTRTAPMLEAGQALQEWSETPPAFTKILVEVE